MNDSNSQNDRSEPSDSEQSEGKSEVEVPKLDFEELAGGSSRILIELQGAIYSLNRTRSGKLVLHK